MVTDTVTPQRWCAAAQCQGCSAPALRKRVLATARHALQASTPPQAGRHRTPALSAHREAQAWQLHDSWHVRAFARPCRQARCPEGARGHFWPPHTRAGSVACRTRGTRACAASACAATAAARWALLEGNGVLRHGGAIDGPQAADVAACTLHWRTAAEQVAALRYDGHPAITLAGLLGGRLRCVHWQALCVRQVPAQRLCVLPGGAFLARGVPLVERLGGEERVCGGNGIQAQA